MKANNKLINKIISIIFGLSFFCIANGADKKVLTDSDKKELLEIGINYHMEMAEKAKHFSRAEIDKYSEEAVAKVETLYNEGKIASLERELYLKKLNEISQMSGEELADYSAQKVNEIQTLNGANPLVVISILGIGISAGLLILDTLRILPSPDKRALFVTLGIFGFLSILCFTQGAY